MAILTLKDIGKIYVSKNNVAVGIRGVNLSFERGEFVAITGKSGSGKSTLLNVISGIDTYEEGELLIEGESTSHYTQEDFETYREKYISFIFQDYNIMESCTVLQNVELALLHIKDPKERKKQALALLDRVGMTSHLHHKASKLSGGQKQRTVIARALAKNSPIILADEPTGNLDSTTSQEIMALLKEVSQDKLLIVVTHNFEEVEAYATRHIRIFDGAIEFDHQLKAFERVDTPINNDQPNISKTQTTLKNSFLLGKIMVTSRPKLSIFMALFLIIGLLALYFVVALMYEPLTSGFEKSYMFTPTNGRVVLTNKNGKALTDEKLAELARNTKATDYLHYDKLLDEYYMLANPYNLYDDHQSITVVNPIEIEYTYLEIAKVGKKIKGRYPEKKTEVFLYLPISVKSYFELENLYKIGSKIALSGVSNYEIVGYKFFYDNNKVAKAVLTKEGFEELNAAQYLLSNSDVQLSFDVEMIDQNGKTANFTYQNIKPTNSLEDDKIYVSDKAYNEALTNLGSSLGQINLNLTANYYERSYYNYQGIDDIYYASQTFDQTNLEESLNSNENVVDGSTIYISTTSFAKIATEILQNSYHQASLFYKNNSEAKKAIKELNELGYIAVLSNTTYARGLDEMIVYTILSIIVLIMFALLIIFLAFFINLCTSRTLIAFKDDIAIMRSMGIRGKEIRLAMYARMFLCLIPAYVVLFILALVIYLNPVTNHYFTFLYPWHYLLIILGMLLMTFRITQKQTKKLYKMSVKEQLKGDNL